MKNKVFSFWGEDEIWGEGGILGNMKFGLRMKNSFSVWGEHEIYTWNEKQSFQLGGEHEIWTYWGT